jgi:hypothetical protein
VAAGHGPDREHVRWPVMGVLTFAGSALMQATTPGEAVNREAPGVVTVVENACVIGARLALAAALVVGATAGAARLLALFTAPQDWREEVRRQAAWRRSWARELLHVAALLSVLALVVGVFT